MALYQYFAISTPGMIGDALSAFWPVYLAPLELLHWSPSPLSSVDPVVAVLLLLGFSFLVWTITLFAIVLLLRRTWRKHVH